MASNARGSALALGILTASLTAGVPALADPSALEQRLAATRAVEEARVYRDYFAGYSRDDHERLLNTALEFRRRVAEGAVRVRALPPGPERDRLQQALNVALIRATFTTQHADQPWVPLDRKAYRLIEPEDAKPYMSLSGLSPEQRAKLVKALREVTGLYWHRPDYSERLDDAKGHVRWVEERVKASHESLLALLAEDALRPYFFALRGPFNEKLAWWREQRPRDQEGQRYFVSVGHRVLDTQAILQRDMSRARAADLASGQGAPVADTLAQGPVRRGARGALEGEAQGQGALEGARRFGGTLEVPREALDRVWYSDYMVREEMLADEGVQEVTVRITDPQGRVVHEGTHRPRVATSIYRVQWLLPSDAPAGTYRSVARYTTTGGEVFEREGDFEVKR